MIIELMSENLTGSISLKLNKYFLIHNSLQTHKRKIQIHFFLTTLDKISGFLFLGLPIAI